jgi:hypothetical protein
MSEFVAEIKQGETIEELREKYREYTKINKRIQRHGENIVLKNGRKPLTEEEKKAKYEAILEKRRRERAEKAMAEGRTIVRGRPSLRGQLSASKA